MRGPHLRVTRLQSDINTLFSSGYRTVPVIATDIRPIRSGLIHYDTEASVMSLHKMTKCDISLGPSLISEAAGKNLKHPYIPLS